MAPHQREPVPNFTNALERMAATLRSVRNRIAPFDVVAVEENSTGRGRVAEQYCLETCLPEMVIRCERTRHPALFHDQKR
jgi:hypothetical protein